MPTINIDKTTRERLRKVGKKGQTYDNILNELLDGVERI